MPVEESQATAKIKFKREEQKKKKNISKAQKVRPWAKIAQENQHSFDKNSKQVNMEKTTCDEVLKMLL